MADILIRQIARGDYPQWSKLWGGYNAFYGRGGVTSLPSRITDTTWARFLEPSEPMHALVAEHSGKLLGLAHFLFHRSTIMVQPICYLQDLYTVEESRGLGIGRALIEAVHDCARAVGSSKVYWQTHETNSAAMQLYDKVADRTGFIVYRKLV